jgi:HemY protein
MLRILWRLLVLIALAAGFAWLADRPGKVAITWLGRDIEMSMVLAVTLLLICFALLSALYMFFRRLWRSPRTARDFWKFRRTQKAYNSLSKGIIAANAGDAHAAAKHASIAGQTLKDEPLLHVLQAQAAQLQGNRIAVKQSFELMAKNPETAVLGLRGLFTEAKQSGDLAAAIGHAEKALALNPRLAWASSAMLQIHSTRKDWTAAAATLVTQSKSGVLPRAETDMKRAIALTAEALAIEDTNRDRALKLAVEAHGLDASLVPAALVAARCHIANASTRKAVRVLSDCWKLSPHPELADVLARVSPGEGATAQYDRVKDLAGDTTQQVEGAYALARAAISAKRYDAARHVLQPHMIITPQARLCVLMAEIEDASGDKGRAREWLARAVSAPRDPIWVADGVAAPRWTPVSPVSGEITRCEWKPPYDMLPEAEEPRFLPTGSRLEATVQATQITHQSVPLATITRAPDDPGVGAGNDETEKQ